MATLLLSKRAASGPRSVGDKISLRGFGKIRFEIVDIATHGDEMYYKVKPVAVVYGVPADLVEEERHSEKKPVEGKAKPPLSKRADETPIIPLERERNRRVIKEIREENERQLKEMGLDRPPEYPERSTFFGDQFLPGDFIVTKKEPGKVWRVIKREESKRLGVAYSVQSMEEALVWAQDVARGMKGGYVLDLPKSEWDVPGRGLPPVGPKAVEEAPRRPSKQEMIEEENKRRLSELTPSERAEEERNRQKWLRMLPLANKLIARLEPLAKGQGTFDHPNRELRLLKEQVAFGYRARLVHQFENAIKEAYWVLKGIPAQEGWKRLQEKRDKERGK
jgi:hypothetical protein